MGSTVGIVSANVLGSAKERLARLQGLKSLIDEPGIAPRGVRKRLVSAAPEEVGLIVDGYNAATRQAWLQRASSAPGHP